MDRYRKLVNNSVIFAIGSLGSKFVSFLMLPLYTYTLATKDYGVTDLVQTTISLLLPVLTLSIFDAVLRFIMDRSKNPDVILSCGFFLTTFSSGLILLVGGVVFYFWPYRYGLYVLILLIIQCFQNLIAQYIKAVGHVKLYALNGLILTFLTAALNVLFLVVLRLGVNGFFDAMILANLISVFYLSGFEKLHRHIKWRSFQWTELKAMIAYSAPLIPNATAWWTTNAVNRYFILYFIGQAANGLFAVANKIPTILSVLNSIFFQAWQLSAIETYEQKDKDAFYKNIFAVYASCLLLGTSWLLVILRPLLHLMVAQTYRQAWLYVPALLLTVVYTSFASFFGQYYIAAKKTFGVFTTTIVAAGLNLLGNFILIPRLGLNGAGLSAMVSFLVLWIIRYFDTKKFVTNQLDLKNILSNHGLILAQIWCLYHWADDIVWATATTFGLALLALGFNRRVLRLFWRFAKIKFGRVHG